MRVITHRIGSFGGKTGKGRGVAGDNTLQGHKKTVFTIVDAFAGKKKLKEALSNAMSLAS